MSVQGFGVFPGDCADGLSLGMTLVQVEPAQARSPDVRSRRSRPIPLPLPEAGPNRSTDDRARY